MTSNSTVVGVVAPGANDTYITYLPNCTTAVSYGDYQVSAANEFDPRRWSYYQDQLHLAIGGWVAAGICLVLAIVFLIWVLTLCACSCCGGVRKRGRAERMAAAGTADDFKGAGWYDGTARLKGFHRRHSALSILLCAAAVVLLIVTLALAAWGLAEGLHATRHVSDDFWSVVHVARIKVGNIKATVTSFFAGIGGLQSTILALASTLDGINLNNLQQQLQLPLNLTGLDSSSVSSALRDIGNSLGTINATGNNITDQIQRYGVHSLQSLETNNKGTVDDIQNKYVPAVLGVLFGVLALLALLATVLLLMRRVKTGGTALALLWFWTALWFFAGPGLLRFGNKVSSDVCLYPEAFAHRFVNETTGISTADKGRIDTGLSYYFGAYGPNMTLDQIINQIYGLDLSTISKITNSTIITDTVNYLATGAAQAVLRVETGLTSQNQQALTDAPAAINATIAGYNSLQRQMSRENFGGLYLQAKELMCCTLANGVRDAWIAWTVAAACAGLLCVVLTARVVQCTRDYTTQPEQQYIVGPPPPANGGQYSHNGSLEANPHLTAGYPPSAPPPGLTNGGNGRRGTGWPSAQEPYLGSRSVQLPQWPHSGEANSYGHYKEDV